MLSFLLGVISSIVATVIIYLTVKVALPNLKDKWLYNGVRVSGTWDVYEERNGMKIKSGTLELTQLGRIINGTSTRTKTRDGNESQRRFNYFGSISAHQMTLIFDDVKGKNFDTGSYVFIIQNDCKTMVGMTTFHGKPENKIVAEQRTLIKVA
ncbi:hypothetical protein ACTUSQ_16955 [Pantoea ananatis]|uniref:hypothetical protein n=1 Tax=Pantoea ananas TaxID=553 RepID=UPI003FA493EA